MIVVGDSPDFGTSCVPHAPEGPRKIGAEHRGVDLVEVQRVRFAELDTPGRLGAVGDRVWTPEELERMKPAEQDAVFEASLGTDTAEMPAEFLERVRSRVQQRIARDKLRSQ